MLGRAILAFVALPGVVAYAIPIALGIFSNRPARRVALAAGVVVIGTFLLLWCVREFYVAGGGTLAPWSPPVRLVRGGPYRWSRNPMYVGVSIVLVGWCVLWGSLPLIAYAVVTLAAFHARVVLAEEPWAARHFGAEWQAYRARVPRWLW